MWTTLCTTLGTGQSQPVGPGWLPRLSRGPQRVLQGIAGSTARVRRHQPAQLRSPGQLDGRSSQVRRTKHHGRQQVALLSCSAAHASSLYGSPCTSALLSFGLCVCSPCAARTAPQNHQTVFVVANKVDLPGRKVSEAEGRSWATVRGYPYVEVGLGMYRRSAMDT